MAAQQLEADGAGRPVLRKEGAPGVEADRVRREADVLRAAAHPGVVQVVGVEEDDEGGVALRLAVAGTRTFADLRTDLLGAARALAGLATTVADLHDLGLVHGRITADHVVLDGAGRAVLCGFAEAGPRGELDPADDVLGLGTLLTAILGRAGTDAHGDWEPIPERRFGRGDRWLGFVRRALLTLADQATDDDPARRPTARGFAAAVLASLPAPGPARPAAGVDPAALLARVWAGVGGVVAAARAGRPAAAPADDDAPLDAVAMLTDGADRGDGERARPWASAAAGWRRLATPIGAALGLGLLVFGLGALLRPAPVPAPAPSSDPGAAGPTATSVVTTASSSVPASSTSVIEAARPAPTCAAAPPPVADPDGDGCPSTAHVGDAVVEVDGVRYGVGHPGDLLAVGDWDCDGTATVALVRRGSGEVFLFDSWATGGADARATSTGTVPGAAAIDAGSTAGRCGALVVVDDEGDRTEVPA